MASVTQVLDNPHVCPHSGSAGLTLLSSDLMIQKLRQPPPSQSSLSTLHTAVYGAQSFCVIIIAPGKLFKATEAQHDLKIQVSANDRVMSSMFRMTTQ